MLEVFIAIGIVVSLGYYELTEISPGGLISPVYLALFIDQPSRIAGTIIVALVISLILKVLRKHLPIYGKRNFAVAVILGIIFKFILGDSMLISFLAIGSIVPGLIAYECDKQGAGATLASLAITCISLKVILVIMQGGYFIWEIGI